MIRKLDGKLPARGQMVDVRLEDAGEAYRVRRLAPDAVRMLAAYSELLVQRRPSEPSVGLLVQMRQIGKIGRWVGPIDRDKIDAASGYSRWVSSLRNRKHIPAETDGPVMRAGKP